ncbi:hypothetical protein ACFE04_017612 [Oxalis oulophora]
MFTSNSLKPLFNWISTPSSMILVIWSGATYVAYNNEIGGVIESLKKDGIADLDTDFVSISEWTSTKAMVSSWLADALMYELWLGTNGTSAWKLYYSDLSWSIGKLLFLKKKYALMSQLGITYTNSEQMEEEIYKKARLAYGALLAKLDDQKFLFENRPSSLDALVLAHVLFSLQALHRWVCEESRSRGTCVEALSKENTAIFNRIRNAR